jgi:hypothetical protein
MPVRGESLEPFHEESGGPHAEHEPRSDHPLVLLQMPLDERQTRAASIAVVALEHDIVKVSRQHGCRVVNIDHRDLARSDSIAQSEGQSGLPAQVHRTNAGAHPLFNPR